MYHSFLIHSSADGHLGCFHVVKLKEKKKKSKYKHQFPKVYNKSCTIHVPEQEFFEFRNPQV